MERSPWDELTGSLTVGSYKFGAILSKLVPGPLSGPTASLFGLPAALTMADRRRMVDRHVRRVVPSASSFERRRIGREVFENYARYYIESFRLPTTSSAEIRRRFTIDGFDHVLEARRLGRGAIVALPHLGGWEWGGRWITDQGIPMTVVVEPLDPPELFDWFVDLRRGFGMNVVPLGPEAGPEILRALARNEIVCLLCDRFISGAFVVVEFFGERTFLPAGPATLALRTGAPLLPAAVYFSDRRSGHHALVRPGIGVHRSEARLREDVRRITQELARELENLIRRDPAQWHLLQPNWPNDPGYPHRIDDGPRG